MQTLHEMTYFSHFDALCRDCRLACLFLLMSLAVCGAKFNLTHYTYEYHATLIGFVAAAKAPPF